MKSRSPDTILTDVDENATASFECNERVTNMWKMRKTGNKNPVGSRFLQIH